MAETRLDKLKETIDDNQAKIGNRIHALLLLLRSRKAKEENHEDQSPYDNELVEMEVATAESIETEHEKEELIPQFQVPVSSLEPSLRINNASPTDCEDYQCVVGFDGLFGHEEEMLQVSDIQARVVVFKKSAGVTNNQIEHQLFDKMSLGVQSKRRRIKCHKSWRFKFKQRKQQRGKPRIAHKLIYKGIPMIDSEDHLSNSMVQENGIEISSDRWLSSSIDCELETGEIDNDEDRVPSDSDLVVNDIEKVKIDLVAIDVDGETDSLIENNQKFQEQAKNRSTNSFLQPSLVPQMCSLLKEEIHQAREENSRFENHKNWVQQVFLEEDSTIHFHEPVSKSENLRKMEVNSVLNYRESVVGVVEKIRQVFDSLPPRTKLLRNRRMTAFSKNWCFKFKELDVRQEDIQNVLLASMLMIAIETRYATTFKDVRLMRQTHMSRRWCEVWQIQTLQDLQQFTLGEVRFQIKHKWRFKLLHLICELNFSLESVACLSLSDDQCDHCIVVRTCCVWTTQMLFGSKGNHVWHRWKARCFYVGMISTIVEATWEFFKFCRSVFQHMNLVVKVLEEGRFDTGKETRRVATRGRLRFEVNQRLRLIGALRL